MKISFILNEHIDKVKWDSCIDGAENGLIYAYSYYLDAMCSNWDALILSNDAFEDEYCAVFPLTWNKKFGMYYLYQPFFLASLGIFGKNISASLVTTFLDAVPAKFKYWDFYLNKGNFFKLQKYGLYQRHNYVLDLHKDYNELYNSYGKSHQRNIKRARDLGYRVEKNIPVEDVVRLAKEQSLHFSPVTQKDYENFTSLYTQVSGRKKAATYGVYSAGGQLVASCVYFYSHGRAYYILVGNHPDGRTAGASHLMIDHFIKENAAKKLLLDFEGSDIKNLAWFYKNFGAIEELYAGIKLNRLPAIAKLFKQ